MHMVTDGVYMCAWAGCVELHIVCVGGRGAIHSPVITYSPSSLSWFYSVHAQMSAYNMLMHVSLHISTWVACGGR